MYRYATIFVTVGHLYGSTNRKRRTLTVTTSGSAMTTSTASLTRHEVDTVVSFTERTSQTAETFCQTYQTFRLTATILFKLIIIIITTEPDVRPPGVASPSAKSI